MSTRKSLIGRSVVILAAAMLVLGAQAWADEHRLPANRTYLIFAQGLEDNPLEGSFGCLVFTAAGEVFTGEDGGEWFIDKRLTMSNHEYGIVFEITGVDTDEGPPMQYRAEGLCWLDNLGPMHSISCSGHAEAEGEMLNFALTGRPLAGGASPEAVARCEDIAHRFNGFLAG